jgi:pimeloyl-ACP methyl ester carboxylesterase
VWEKQIDYFHGRHEVLALDLPGHGARLGERAFESHERNADEVARAVQARGFAQLVLVGHSMGGAVVLSVALRHPGLAEALVLVASGARLRMPGSLIEAARQKAETMPPGQVVGSLVPLEVAVSPAASAETRTWLNERVGQSSAQATYADFVANDRFDVMERLSEIEMPTLVIAGQDDQMTPPKFQQFLAERLPRARLVLLPDAGHYVQVEQPEAFNRELEQLIDEGRRTREE